MTNAFSKGKGKTTSAGVADVLNFSRSLAHEDARLNGSVRQELDIARVQPNPDQPRRYFADQALEELADSIRQQGVLQPILVRQKGDMYEIVFGERRYRAAIRAGLQRIPALVRELSDEQASVVAAVENLQRENLNPFEEASFKLRLIAAALDLNLEETPPLLRKVRYNPAGHPEVTQRLEALFENLGGEKWTSFVVNKLPVLNLPEPMHSAVRRGELDYSKALLIARAPRGKHAELLKDTIQNELSQEALKARIKSEQAPSTGLGAEVQNIRKVLTPRRVEQLKGEQRSRVERLLKELQDALGAT